MLSNFGVSLMPSAGASLPLFDSLLFRSSVGRSFRAPALDELYHPSQRGFSGNPDLKPESAWEGELGLKWQFKQQQYVDVSAFARHLDDTILYLNRNAFEVRPENVGQADVVGFEIESRSRFSGSYLSLGVVLSGSILWSELEATGKVIPTQPSWSTNTELFVRLPWLERDPLELFVRTRLVASTTANLQSTLAIPQYARTDTGLSYILFDEVALSLTVTNVFDDKSLLTVTKLPLPGRIFLASIRVSDLANN